MLQAAACLPCFVFLLSTFFCQAIATSIPGCPPFLVTPQLAVTCSDHDSRAHLSDPATSTRYTHVHSLHQPCPEPKELSDSCLHMLPPNLTMSIQGLRQRQMPVEPPVIAKLKAQRTKTPARPQDPEPAKHPAGDIKHGAFAQALRMFLFAAYFAGSIVASVYTHGG